MVCRPIFSPPESIIDTVPWYGVKGFLKNFPWGNFAIEATMFTSDGIQIIRMLKQLLRADVSVRGILGVETEKRLFRILSILQ